MRGHYICPRGNRKRFRLDYGLRLTILDVSLPANKLCNINVPGMTNPNMLIPANADTIQHRVISMYGGMPLLG